MVCLLMPAWPCARLALPAPKPPAATALLVAVLSPPALATSLLGPASMVDALLPSSAVPSLPSWLMICKCAAVRSAAFMVFTSRSCTSPM